MRQAFFVAMTHIALDGNVTDAVILQNPTTVFTPPKPTISTLAATAVTAEPSPTTPATSATAPTAPVTPPVTPPATAPTAAKPATASNVKKNWGIVKADVLSDPKNSGVKPEKLGSSVKASIKTAKKLFSDISGK